MQFRAIVVDSIRESLDRKIFWVILMITGLVVLTMASVAFNGDRVSFLFGLWEATTERFNPVTSVGRSRILGFVVYLLLMTGLGWIGTILAVIATSSFFPTMLQRGTIDVLVSKPISRPRLFLYKYIGSMVFVLIQATAFIGLTFLVMGFRWGLWAPGYLLSIPLMVLLFSYVYCVSVLVAVKTRSTGAAILLSLAAWFVYSAPATARDMFETYPDLQQHKRLYQTIKLATWIPPKTGDIPYIAARWARAGASIDIFPDELMSSGAGSMEREQLDRARQLEQEDLKKNPWVSIGSSLLFEALVVLWAMWIFTRQDY